MSRTKMAQEFAAEDCAERINEGEIKFQIDENAKVYKGGTAVIDGMFYYSSFAIQEQAKTSKKWKYELKPVITVAILNFTAFDERFRANLAYEGVYKFSYRSACSSPFSVRRKSWLLTSR